MGAASAEFFLQENMSRPWSITKDKGIVPMCLAIPSKIVSIDQGTSMGVIETMGVTREANLSLIDEEIAVGDWVLVHVGLAISKVDAKEARKTLDMYQEIIELQDGAAHEGG